MISASEWNTAVVRSNGTVVAFGADHWGQCSIPALPTYTQVAAGDGHTVLLRSDGEKRDCKLRPLRFMDIAEKQVHGIIFPLTSSLHIGHQSRSALRKPAVRMVSLFGLRKASCTGRAALPRK